MTPDFLAGYDQALDDARRWGWRRPDRFLVVAALVVGFMLGLGVANVAALPSGDIPARAGTTAQAFISVGADYEAEQDYHRIGAPDRADRPAATTVVVGVVGAMGASPFAPSAAGAPLSGTFSWHATGRHGAYAAACGAFREQVPNWRGQSVTVTGPAGSLALVVNDFCRNETRLLDLSDEAFVQVCGSLSLGVCRGTVGGLRPPETDVR